MRMLSLALLCCLAVQPLAAAEADKANEPMVTEPTVTQPATPAKPAKQKSGAAKQAQSKDDRLKDCATEADSQALQSHARKRYIGECMAAAGQR
ncbi:MAG TPA: hypothetical protein VL974_16895 [Magnetospirillum sp.]|jgi:hypothetical protein|nr:hypothetical protein [Magnetospirillum sp.]